MTYEQAGGGFAGLGIRTETGDTLTLRDRLTHHYTTGMSTVEVSSQNANRVVDEFEKYYRDNLSNPPGTYKTYIIKADNNADKLARLAAWMDSHGIKYGHPAAGKATRGYDFSSQNTGAVSYTSQDIVVNTFQSKSRFITTAFEPTSKLSDSVTYDITAWNLMYAYGLKGYALTERINPVRSFTPPTQHVAPADKPYAYILKYQTLEDVAFVASLLNQGVKLRAAKTPFTISGENFAMGAVLALRGDNKNTTDFDTKVKTAAKAADRRLYTSTTGFVDKGKDFGSGDMMYLQAPRIATLVGDQTSSLSAGEVWHFFEQQIHYPVTQIGTDYFRNVDLSAYDVLIVPSGYYRMFDESTLADLGEWVSGGGRLILISNAVAAFADKKGFGLTQYASEEEKRAAEKKEEAAKQKEGLLAYKDAERFYIQETIAGAIYKVTLDTSHPLAYGMTGSYYTLKTGELYYSLLQDDWNVGRIAGKARPVQGFSGHKINAKLDNTVIFGVEEKGGGTIIYMVDNPLFRCFWEEGKMIFANAVFMVGNN
ncbi:MAG: hypothetical protein HC859_05135 [Bacteroidia bacterium]|nr:hypothetical protein [Bacteroidia bacterium]